MSMNTFNICPRCGTSNGANAKFCYQCGGRLKVADEPTICPNCHTVNTGSANFCKTCGGKLLSDVQTKICPSCHREVPAEQSVCRCGHSFALHTTGNLSQLKGRWLGIVSLVIMLLFAVYVFVPQTIGGFDCRFSFMASDSGVMHSDDATFYGYEIVVSAVKQVKNVGMQSMLDGDLVAFTVFVLTAIFALTLIVQLVCAGIHIGTDKRTGNRNVFYLVMFVASILAVAVLFFADKFGFLSWFTKNAVCKAGYAIWAIPAYYLLFYIVSLFSSQRKNKIQK